MEKLIEISGLCKSYDRTVVLRDLDMTLEPGRIVGLLGPNGCGKTTLIKIITGLIHDYTGSVHIAGQPPGIESKAIISYLPDHIYLDGGMRAKDAILHFADFYEDFDLMKALELLGRFKLDSNQRLSAMSKGMQERLQLVLVMSRAARVYLLDEPLGGVDPAARNAILDMILNNYSENAAVLLSTHLIQDVERIFDSVLMLNEGQIVINDTVDNIRSQYGKSVNEVFQEVFACSVN